MRGNSQALAINLSSRVTNTHLLNSSNLATFITLCSSQERLYQVQEQTKDFNDPYIPYNGVAINCDLGDVYSYIRDKDG